MGSIVLHIIIDGYNLIGTSHKDMEKAREGLIDLLISYKNIKNHDITVIFDAYKQGDKYERSSLSGGVKIIYTRLGETADDVIKRIISEVRKEWVIITSDRDVVKHTWSVHSIPVPSEVFFDILQRTLKNTSANIEEDWEETIDINEIENIKPQGGSAYRLSKKHRSIKRILGKL